MNEEIQRRLDECWEEAEQVLVQINDSALVEKMRETFRFGFMAGWSECIKFATEELLGKE